MFCQKFLRVPGTPCDDQLQNHQCSIVSIAAGEELVMDRMDIECHTRGEFSRAIQQGRWNSFKLCQAGTQGLVCATHFRNAGVRALQLPPQRASDQLSYYTKGSACCNVAINAYVRKHCNMQVVRRAKHLAVEILDLLAEVVHTSSIEK